MNGELNRQEMSSTSVEDDDAMISEEITEALLAWLEADALADDFDEDLTVTPEEVAAGQAALDAYRNAHGASGL